MIIIMIDIHGEIVMFMMMKRMVFILMLIVIGLIMWRWLDDRSDTSMWLFEAEVPKLYEILLFRWLVLQNLRSGQKSVMIWIHFHCDNQHCSSYLWNVQCTLIPYSDQKTKTGNTITWKCQTSVLDFLDFEF